jgi:hypothetical protein
MAVPRETGHEPATHRGRAGPVKFARTIAAAFPIATPPDPSFAPLAVGHLARYGCVVRNPQDVEKTQQNQTSGHLQGELAQIADGRGKTSGGSFQS